jgi:predicted nucleotidyltransferase
MATTVWLDEPSRDELVRLKAFYGVTSLGAVVRCLLNQPQETAKQLYRRRKRQVEAACKKFGVAQLIAFGSRARGDARPGGDLDIVVTFAKPIDFGQFLDVKEAIAQAFACPTDVIEPPTHRPRMMEAIERDGVVLFG